MEIEQKHLVFISSTYKDLVTERAQISQHLLEVNCIPTGMELFGAQVETSLDVIYKTIDQVDLYVLVLAGRYGSIPNNKTKSYTEIEFDYATRSGKDILVFLHEEISELSGKKLEQDQEKKRKLEEFRSRIKSQAAMWNDNNLIAKISAAVSRWKETHKKQGKITGWVNLSNTGPIEDVDLVVEIMKQEIIELAINENKLHKVVKKNTSEIIDQLRNLRDNKIRVATHVLYEQIVDVMRDRNYSEYFLVDHAIFRWNELVKENDSIGYNTFEYSPKILDDINERAREDANFKVTRLLIVDDRHLNESTHRENLKIIMETFSEYLEEGKNRIQNKVLVVESKIKNSLLRKSITELKQNQDIVLVKAASSGFLVYRECIDYTIPYYNKNGTKTDSYMELISIEKGQKLIEYIKVAYDNALTINDFIKYL